MAQRMAQRMANHAQNALDAKLEQIEALVKCIEIKRTQEDLQALLEELQQAKDEALDLKTQIEVAEQDFAQIEGKFKKYQASVDAGALHISQRLSEFDTPTARQQARANLELDTIDGGVFT